MSRFTNLPARLREVAAFDADQRSDMGNWLAAQGTIEDAALRIEALERDLARLREDRSFIIGWNDGWEEAAKRAASIADDVKAECMKYNDEKCQVRGRGAGYVGRRIRREMKLNNGEGQSDG